MTVQGKLSIAGLGAVAQTLLIPLSARALAGRLNPDLAFRDRIAEALLERLDTDPRRFAGDRGSMRGSLIRACWFDQVARHFLNKYRDGLVVSMGSGLDARAQRIGYTPIAGGSWIDLDVPEVVSLRRALLPKSPGVSDLDVDLNNIDWLDQLPWRQGQPALFLAEGVTMYLRRESAERLIRAIGYVADRKKSFTGLAFDYASPWLVRHSRWNPAAKKTAARFGWALGHPSDLRDWDPQLRFVEQHSVAAVSGKLAVLLSKIHRVWSGRELHACVRFERGMLT